ncbi:MAG: ribokinase [Puniceicoccaceae bacterium]|nr:MAG: ribokinase [Puniceicoccaceae bacterium]
MKPILVVGSSNVDFIMQVPHLPAKGETVIGGTFSQVFGGKGANQAYAVARSGGRTVFITALGDDPHAPNILEGFSTEGISTKGVLQCADTPTGAAVIIVDREGSNVLAVASGANANLQSGHLRSHSAIFREAALVVLQMEVPLETVRTALELARAAGVPALLNYAPAQTIDTSLLDGLAYLVVNEVEAEALGGIAPGSEAANQAAADALHQLGVRTVILTLGTAGVFVSSGDSRFHVPAFRVEAVDTTAAGDTFCGALAAALVERGPDKLREAVRFASAAAAISVTGLGAQPSIPKRDTIETFLTERGSSS